MMIPSNSPFKLLSSLIVLVLLPLLSLSADPDPLQDFCVADFNATISVNGFPCKPTSSVTSDDFFFDLSKEGNTTNFFSAAITSANVLAFPGLNTLGVSMNRVDYAPGGINPLHSHPRATEFGVIIKGKVLVGFVTSGNVYYSKVLTSGQIFVIPRGVVHFQKNVGKKKALAFTGFNSALPGAIVLPRNLFGSKPSIPNDVLTQTFQVDDYVVNDIKSKFGS